MEHQGLECRKRGKRERGGGGGEGETEIGGVVREEGRVILFISSL